MSKASLLESGGVGAVHSAKKTVFVISITCTAPLFIIANKTHMHTHCSRENVAHKITPGCESAISPQCNLLRAL